MDTLQELARPMSRAPWRHFSAALCLKEWISVGNIDDALEPDLDIMRILIKAISILQDNNSQCQPCCHSFSIMRFSPSTLHSASTTFCCQSIASHPACLWRRNNPKKATKQHLRTTYTLHRKRGIVNKKKRHREADDMRREKKEERSWQHKQRNRCVSYMKVSIAGLQG